MNDLTWEEFDRIDMRIGTILTADVFEEVKNPAYRLTIDFGDEIGIKKSSAQITSRYTTQELIGLQVVAVINFPKKQIATMMSECLVLGAVNNKDVTLISPNKSVENGLRIA